MIDFLIELVGNIFIVICCLIFLGFGFVWLYNFLKHYTENRLIEKELDDLKKNQK